MSDKSGYFSWSWLRRFAFPLLWLVIFLFFFTLREIAAPFIGAVLLAYLLAPLVDGLCSVKIRLGRWRPAVPRWVAVVFIYFVLVVVVGGYLGLTLPRVGAEFGKLARESHRWLEELTPQKIDEHVQAIKEWAEQSGLPVQVVAPTTPLAEKEPVQPEGAFVLELDEIIRESLFEITETMREGLITFLKLGPQFAARAFRGVMLTFLILMVAAFLLINPRRVFDFMRSLFPSRLHASFDETLREMDRGLSGVVRGQVLICLVNGLLTFFGLIIFKVKFPVLLATLAAVMSLVPIFGSILSSIPIVAVALTSSMATGVWILLWIIGIHLLEANLLNPKIMGEAARIHPALVVFVLLAGEHFYGVVGALFAVPLTSLGLAVFRVFHRRALRWSQEAERLHSLGEKT